MLLARAYRRWGDVFPRQLHGAFAFAIWDGRKLLLGRDTAGGRTLYYAQSDRAFFFASELAGLSVWPQVDWTIHDPFVAAGICNYPPREAARTLFEGIRRLLPATTLSFDAGRATTATYWNPLDVPVWRGAQPREYAQALRATLRAAIALRIPSGAKIGTRLSSGWDSSTVTALTAQILAEQGRTLTAFTAVPASPVPTERFAATGRVPDEHPLAALIAARYANVESVAVPNAGPALGDAMTRLALTSAVPGLFRGVVMVDTLSRAAQERNIDVVFGAAAGNYTTSYSGAFGPWTLLHQRRWPDLVRALLARRRAGATGREIFRTLYSPVGTLASLLAKLRGSRPVSLRDASGISPFLLERSGLDPTGMSRYFPGDPPQDGRAFRALILGSADLGRAQSHSRRYFDFDFHDPTGDRRVIELCLSIPDEAFAPEGVPRGLARLAFEDDLPAALLDGKVRGLQSADFCERFDEALPWIRSEFARMERSSSIGRYLDLPSLRQMLNDWPGVAAAGAALDRQYSARFGQAFAWGHLLLLLEDRGGRL